MAAATASQAGSDKRRPGFDGAPVIMGILNVTDDSFSDGGMYVEPELALRHASAMHEEGAAIIDVGAESSRPGSLPVAEQEQQRRLVPVVQAIRAKLPDSVAVSVDTRSAAVAAAALDAGADWINDISAGRDDPGLLPLAARRGAPVVLMHMQGNPANMQDNPHYEDVCAEVRDFLRSRVAAAVAAGIARSDIMVDPGIGFGKSREHNMELLRGLRGLVSDGSPVLLGTSRKGFMRATCGEATSKDLVGATCASTVWGLMAGVKVFRVHDVRDNRQAVQLFQALGKH